MNARVILSITIAVVAIWAGAASQLTILFGQQLSTIIVTICSMIVLSLSAALGVLSNQTNQVTSVRQMAGVENIMVNAKASPALAAMAVDPAVQNVQAMPGAKPALTEIALAA